MCVCVCVFSRRVYEVIGSNSNLSEDAIIFAVTLGGWFPADEVPGSQSFSFSGLRMFFCCALDLVIAALCGFPRLCLGVKLLLLILLASRRYTSSSS